MLIRDADMLIGLGDIAKNICFISFDGIFSLKLIKLVFPFHQKRHHFNQSLIIVICMQQNVNTKN